MSLLDASIEIASREEVTFDRRNIISPKANANQILLVSSKSNREVTAFPL